jgi:heme-degrading monooxygenase HmoA
MIQIIWEYKVKPENTSKFEDVYGNKGEWFLFFRKSKAFKKTELVVKDLENNIYLTIDTWKSLESYEQFLTQNKKEYKGLENKNKALFTDKKELGIFSEE